MANWNEVSLAHICNNPVVGTATSRWMVFSNLAMRGIMPYFLIASRFLWDEDIDQSALAPALAMSRNCNSSWFSSSRGVTRYLQDMRAWHECVRANFGSMLQLAFGIQKLNSSSLSQPIPRYIYTTLF